MLVFAFSSFVWADDPLLESLTPVATQSGERQVRGVLRAHNQAVLSSELPGRIIEMPFSDGQDFNKNDVLVRFDCSVTEQRTQQDLAIMFKDQEPLSGPLTLHEAMARAVKYNLEARLKVMEEAMAQRQVDLATFDMLPRMALSAGYAGRNNVSAKQQGDQRLIVQERRRKVVHTIIQDVRSAYWRAVAADRLLTQIDSLMARVAQARDNSQRLSEQRIGDPTQALSYQRALIEATRQLEEQRRALSLAKIELATLINLPLRTQVKLAPDAGYQIPELKVELDTLEQEALASRPELREQDYQARISAAETRKAMLRLLPGLEFSAGGHYDSNSLLVNQSWADYGVKVTWNLFNVLSAPTAIDVAKAGQEVVDARRQAMSMAILAQLHVANANFREAQRQFQTSQQLAGLDGQIVEQLRNRYQAQGIGELELIQDELNTLQADLRRDLAYAELRNSYGQLFASAGLDPLPESVASDSVADIAAELSNREAQWQAGQL